LRIRGALRRGPPCAIFTQLYAEGVTGPVIRLLFAGELLRHRELLLAVAPYTGIGHGSHEFLKELIVRLRRRNEIADRETGGTGPETAAVQYCELLREVDGIPELFIKLRDSGR
jgi:hypothetical protein